MTSLATAGAALWVATVLLTSAALWQRLHPVQPGVMTTVQRLAIGAAVALATFRTYLCRDGRDS